MEGQLTIFDIKTEPDFSIFVDHPRYYPTSTMKEVIERMNWDEGEIGIDGYIKFKDDYPTADKAIFIIEGMIEYYEKDDGRIGCNEEERKGMEYAYRKMIEIINQFGYTEKIKKALWILGWGSSYRVEE